VTGYPEKVFGGFTVLQANARKGSENEQPPFSSTIFPINWCYII
jgi:hypothetical protein